MKADDDPEARIADLERPLLESATASEAPSARVGLRLGWIAFALMVLGLIVGGGAILGGRDSSPVTGRPTMIGGGGTVAETPSAPSGPASRAPEVAPPHSPESFPGGVVSVAGVGNQRTIACTGNAITVSGVDNDVALTGHCSRVDVSGVRNTVAVASADAIVVSGMDNTVTFRSGTPELTNSGLDNTVERG